MSIDERLDRLVERHEALTMTVGMLTRDIEEFRAGTTELRLSMDNLHATAVQDGENIRPLAGIAEIHERRLTSLEGGE
jgi:hypothetical protein